MDLIDGISKGIRIFPINVNDQRQLLRVAVYNDEGDVFELVRLSIRPELIGNLVGLVVKHLNWLLGHSLNFELGRLCYHERVEKTCLSDPPQQGLYRRPNVLNSRHLSQLGALPGVGSRSADRSKFVAKPALSKWTSRYI